MKKSSMTLSADVTLLGDQLFTCRVTVGEKDGYDDTLVPLKTFTVRYVTHSILREVTICRLN